MLGIKQPFEISFLSFPQPLGRSPQSPRLTRIEAKIGWQNHQGPPGGPRSEQWGRREVSKVSSSPKCIRDCKKMSNYNLCPPPSRCGNSGLYNWTSLWGSPWGPPGGRAGSDINKYFSALCPGLGLWANTTAWKGGCDREEAGGGEFRAASQETCVPGPVLTGRTWTSGDQWAGRRDHGVIWGTLGPSGRSFQPAPSIQAWHSKPFLSLSRLLPHSLLAPTHP